MRQAIHSVRWGVAMVLLAACSAAAAPPATAPATAMGSSADAAAHFRAFCAAAATTAEKSDKPLPVVGREGWLFFGRELRHLSAGEFWGDAAAKVSSAARPDLADPTPAILDFAAQLDKLGVELILLPVPAKATVYPEMLADLPAGDTPAHPDAADRAFFDLLRAQHVKVIDVTGDLVAAKATGAPLFCRQDSHWSPRACEIAAARVAKDLADRPWLAALKRNTYATAAQEVEITGDLYRDLPDAGKVPREKLTLRKVGAPTALGEVTGERDDKSSPILLLGDSHTLVFHDGSPDMHARGAGLADQLALELGMRLDVIGVRGSGATPARVNLARAARADAAYLKGKKLVIWCFTVREFTQSTGWQKVPLVKAAPPVPAAP